jgi:hypothetical protein
MIGRALGRIERVEAALAARLRAADVATVHEAQARTGLIASCKRPTQAGSVVAGPAVTALWARGGNWMVHVAIELMTPGDVLVVRPGLLRRTVSSATCWRRPCGREVSSRPCSTPACATSRCCARQASPSGPAPSRRRVGQGDSWGGELAGGVCGGARGARRRYRLRRRRRRRGAARQGGSGR